MSMTNSAGQTIIITMHMSTSTGQRINWSMGRVITCSMFSQALTNTNTNTDKHPERDTQTHADTDTDTDRHQVLYRSGAQQKNCTSRSVHSHIPEHAMFLVSALSMCKIKVFGRNASVHKKFCAPFRVGVFLCLCLSVSTSVCAERERQIETQIETQTDTPTETQTDTPTDRRTDTHRRTHRDRHTDSRE